MKLGIIIDSSSGLTFKEAKEKNWEFLPLHISINNKSYDDGITLTNKIFYSIINENDKVSSSCSSLGEITNLFDQIYKKYDEIIYLPISYYLSSQNQFALQVASNYKNIHVIKSETVGFAIASLLESGEKLINNNVPINNVIKKIEEATSKTWGMIVPQNLTWLKNGGRINKSIAALGNLLNIVPIISFHGKLEKWGKGRSLQKCMIKACNGLLKILSKQKNKYIFYLYSAIAKDDEKGKKMEEKISLQISKILKKEIIHKTLPRVLAIHVGPGSFCLQAVPLEI